MNLSGLPSLSSNWAWAELGDVLLGIDAGKSFKCVERPPGNGEVGVVKVSAVTWGTFDENESKTCTDPERVDERLFIHTGDFLISRANTIQLVGACVIVGGISRRLMLSDKILRLRINGVDHHWILYVLRSPWGRSEIERLATGNQESMRNIGQDRIRSIRVPVPPVLEQERIITAFETQHSRLETACQSLRRAKLHLQYCSAAQIEAAFSALPAVQNRKLGDLGEIVGGLTKAENRKAPGSTRAVPYLRVANVQRGYLDLRQVRLIEATEQEIQSLRLRFGDVLLNEGGDRNKLGRG